MDTKKVADGWPREKSMQKPNSSSYQTNGKENKHDNFIVFAPIYNTNMYIMNYLKGMQTNFRVGRVAYLCTIPLTSEYYTDLYASSLIIHTAVTWL